MSKQICLNGFVLENTTTNGTRSQILNISTASVLSVKGYSRATSALIGGDANNLVSPATYYMTSGAAISNMPEANPNGILMIDECYAMIIQTYIRYDGTTWTRVKWVSSWYPWKQITN